MPDDVVMDYTCECDSVQCHLTVKISAHHTRRFPYMGNVAVIVDGCPHGPRASDVLVERGPGYGIYIEKLDRDRYNDRKEDHHTPNR